MEKVEGKAQAIYEEISRYIPAAIDIEKDEKEHERKLIDLIDEERLRYIGSMVLCLNDALVELTGALAGFTLAFRNTHLIAMAGFITGIAASLSMATFSEIPDLTISLTTVLLKSWKNLLFKLAIWV